MVKQRPPYRLYNAVPCVVCWYPARSFWPGAYVVHGASHRVRRCIVDLRKTEVADHTVVARLRTAEAA